MSIWHLLTSLCFFMPIAGSVLSAVRARVGIGGYAIALCSGAITGTCCAIAMLFALKAVWSYSQHKGESAQNRYLVAVSLAIVPWMVIAGLLGRWVSAATLNIF